jgi:hypothetical protein
MHTSVKRAFWLTNISNRNVSLADLNLTIKAFSSVNLLDNRHYSYSLEELNNSVKAGSIAKKRDKIVVRQVAPKLIKNNIVLNHDTFIPSRERSTYSIKEEHYEELNISDEDFAKENADTAEIDANKQIISKG